MTRNVALLLAAGSGRRAGRPKQFERAGGRSLLEWACDPFLACREIHGIIVVAPRAELERVRRLARRACGDRLLDVVAGGKTRHESSRAGLAALVEDCEIVLIHDVARPFVSPRLVRRVLRAARSKGAAIPAVAVADSIVETRSTGTVVRYRDRTKLQKVQTPQGFRRKLLHEAFARTRRRDWSDDASVIRAAGRPVAVVAGEAGNWKVTTAEELQTARGALSSSRRRQGD